MGKTLHSPHSPKSNHSSCKVVLVGKSMSVIGGIQKVNKALMESFHADGAQCEIFSYRDAGDGGLATRIKSFIADVSRFHQAARIEGVQFVFNVTGAEILVFSLISELYGRHFYYWLHGDPSVFEHNKSSVMLSRFFYRRAKGVIVLHPVFIERIRADGANIICIPNSIPQPDVLPMCGSKAIRKVVWIGRISAEKNPALAFDTLKILARRYPRISFHFIFPFSQDSLTSYVSPFPNLQLLDGSSIDVKTCFDSETLHLLTSTLEAMPGVLFESISRFSRFLSTACSPWVTDLVNLGYGTSVPVDISAESLAEQAARIIDGDAPSVDTGKLIAFCSKLNPLSVLQMWKTLLGIKR